MSGSLMPSVPLQIMLKFDPPKMTIVYHFERNDRERFYHEIPIEKSMLESVDNEEICSHLFLSEAYYFNPKQIPRKQVRPLHSLKLITDSLLKHLRSV